jgi:hypothetical protein
MARNKQKGYVDKSAYPLVIGRSQEVQRQEGRRFVLKPL